MDLIKKNLPQYITAQRPHIPPLALDGFAQRQISDIVIQDNRVASSAFWEKNKRKGIS